MADSMRTSLSIISYTSSARFTVLEVCATVTDVGLLSRLFTLAVVAHICSSSAGVQGPALGLGVYLRPDSAALRSRSPAFLRRAWMRVCGGAGPEVELAAFPLVSQKPARCRSMVFLGPARSAAQRRCRGSPCQGDHYFQIHPHRLLRAVHAKQPAALAASEQWCRADANMPMQALPPGRHFAVLRVLTSFLVAGMCSSNTADCSSPLLTPRRGPSRRRRRCATRCWGRPTAPSTASWRRTAPWTSARSCSCTSWSRGARAPPHAMLCSCLLPHHVMQCWRLIAWKSPTLRPVQRVRLTLAITTLQSPLDLVWRGPWPQLDSVEPFESIPALLC